LPDLAQSSAIKDASQKLYAEILDIPFKEDKGGHFHTEALRGVKQLRDIA
jgi:hypothetical protein